MVGLLSTSEAAALKRVSAQLRVLDASGCVVIPGFVDMRVHITGMFPFLQVACSGSALHSRLPNPSSVMPCVQSLIVQSLHKLVILPKASAFDPALSCGTLWHCFAGRTSIFKDLLAAFAALLQCFLATHGVTA